MCPETWCSGLWITFASNWIKKTALSKYTFHYSVIYFQEIIKALHVIHIKSYTLVLNKSSPETHFQESLSEGLVASEVQSCIFEENTASCTHSASGDNSEPMQLPIWSDNPDGIKIMAALNSGQWIWQTFRCYLPVTVNNCAATPTTPV